MSFLRSLTLTSLYLASVAFSNQATATAYLGISPMQVNLSPSSKTSVVTVFNKDSKPVNLQIDAKGWEMDENGKIIETDTGEFVFYPKILTIKANEQATIRVGYTGEIPETEKPYRLFIDEIPEITQPQAEKNKVNMGLTTSLHLSIPLYVVSANDIPAPQVELSAIKADNSLRLGVKNLTAYHVSLKKVAVKLLKQDKVLAEKTVELKLQRILGNHLLFVDLPMDAKKLCQQADAIQVQIDVENLAEPYQTKVALKSGCQL